MYSKEIFVAIVLIVDYLARYLPGSTTVTAVGNLNSLFVSKKSAFIFTSFNNRDIFSKGRASECECPERAGTVWICFSSGIGTGSEASAIELLYQLAYWILIIVIKKKCCQLRGVISRGDI